MSWLSDLFMTYEVCKDEVGIIEGERPVLLPIAHSTQNAQVEIVLDDSGNFIRAVTIDKKEMVTVIPVTEDSASRSSGVEPHPLADRLEYIAGDYGKYVVKYNPQKYIRYMNSLKEWANSEFSQPEIKSVYQYLCKQTVMSDLVKAGILQTEDGRLKKYKIDVTDQKDFFVRFSVEQLNGIESRLYQNTKIFDSYILYYLAQKKDKEMCYISGEIIPCSDKHPSKIRHAADKAKLISSNDTSGFTYRGRFTSSNQVASIGYEYSQKAHNALRWLISKQSCLRAGEQVFVVWSIENKALSSPFLETLCMIESKVDTDEEYSKNIRKAIWGSSEVSLQNSHVISMGVEAATTGRLSITYYQNYSAEIFVNNVIKWKQQVKWFRWSKKEKQYMIWSPSLVDIVRQAVGDKNDKVVKATRERLIPCIVEGRKIPNDIVKMVINNSLNPRGFSETSEWKRCIQLACALIRKMQIDKKIVKEECDMALDVNNTDRSYLFGRLLATAEMLEKKALGEGDGAKRNTAAERYFQRYQRYPAQTYKVIRDTLQPYIMKLNSIGKPYYCEQLNEIIDLFSEDDFYKKESLQVSFLQGYSSQIMKYISFKKDNSSNINEKDNKE